MRQAARLISAQKPLKVVDFIARPRRVAKAATEFFQNALRSLGGWQARRIVLAPRLVATFTRFPAQWVRRRCVASLGSLPIGVSRACLVSRLIALLHLLR